MGAPKLHPTAAVLTLKVLLQVQLAMPSHGEALRAGAAMTPAPNMEVAVTERTLPPPMRKVRVCAPVCGCSVRCGCSCLCGLFAVIIYQ